MPLHPVNFRAPDQTVDQITDLSAKMHGLSKTKIFILAIDRLHAAVCRPAATVTRSKHRTSTKDTTP
jgi:hypothetical protein